MSDDVQRRLLQSVYACMRPLARMLLRTGVSYQQFADAAKLAFVQEALLQSDHRGRRTNISRVAARTGLSRKEVGRIRRSIEADDANTGNYGGDSSRSGHAARALQIWHSEAEFLGLGGTPIELAMHGESPCFASLVRLAGGDIPPGAIRAELLAAQAIEETRGGRLRAIKRHFIPSDVVEEMIVGLTHIVGPALEGVDHNSSNPDQAPFFQRVAYSDRLVPSSIPMFQVQARERSTDFIQSIDDWLVAHEYPEGKNPDHLNRVAVGVFYFEGPVSSGDADR